MVNEVVMEKRKKPTFLRRDNHKKIKFGKGVKKNQKWRAAKGRQNKIRLGQRGYGARPTVGYGSSKAVKGKLNGLIGLRVANLNDLVGLKSGEGIVIASVGRKKREEIIKKANEMKLVVLNKYQEKKE